MAKSFRELFPLTAFLAKLIFSRWLLRVVGGLLLALGLVSTALRLVMLHAGLQLNSVSESIRNLELHRTPKAEVLAKLPPMDREDASAQACDSEECYSWTYVRSTVPDRFWRGIPRSAPEWVTEAADNFGFREVQFHLTVGFKQGVLDSLAYRLRASGPHYHPGMVWITAHSSHSPVSMEDPGFAVNRYFKWRELSGDFRFSERTTKRRLAHALTFDARCLGTIPGCREAEDMVPYLEEAVAEQEYLETRRAYSDNPCPDDTLPTRGEVATSVWLTKIIAFYPEPESSGASRYYAVDFAPMKAVLRTTEREHAPPRESWIAEEAMLNMRMIPNPALNFAKAGNQVLIFGGNSTHIDRACEMLPFTSERVKALLSGYEKAERRRVEREQFIAAHPRNPDPPPLPPQSPRLVSENHICSVITGKPFCH